MSANVPQNQDDQEIDLFVFLKKIANFPQWISATIFKWIQFFIKNIIVFSILFILGFGVGLYIDDSQELYDHQIIVKTNFESTNYLYSKIDLIQSKISERDLSFFKSIGIKNPLEITKISVEPIVDIYNFINSSDQNMQLLQLMAENGDLKTIVKESTTSRNYNYHTIILSTNGVTHQNDVVNPILDYLNTSQYFKEIQKISVGNIQQMIKEKEATILQIDAILNSFSNRNDKALTSDKLIYYNDNTALNSIIRTKDTLVNVLGTLKINLFNSRKVINDNAVILNIKNDKFINGKFKYILPFLMISLFILTRSFISFYRKQRVIAG